MKKIVAGLSASLMLAVPASAHEQEVRSAGAHVHGKGDAFLSLTGDILSFDLSAPKANFMLASGEMPDYSGADLPAFSDLIGISDKAGCELQTISIEEMVVGQSDGTHEHADDHDHHNDEEAHEHHEDHDDHEAHEHHEEHDDHDAHEHHEEHEGHDDHAGHMDYLLSMSLQCKKPEQIRKIDFTLFETYSGFEEVNLIFEAGDDMIATNLNSKKTSVDRP